MKQYLVPLFSLWFTFQIQAQRTINIDSVIQAGISHNFNIQLAKNTQKVSENNATIGNAGFLPTADVSGGYTFQNGMSKTSFRGNIPDQEEPFASSQNYNASVNLRYTIFDGLKPMYTLDQFKVQASQDRMRYQQEIENMILSLIEPFYNLASIQDEMVLVKEKLKLTRQQMRRVEIQKKYGQGNELELLNLQTSYNLDSTQFLRLNLSKSQFIHQLNRIVGIEYLSLQDIIEIDRTIDLSLQLETVKKACIQNNKTLLIAQQNIRKAELDYKIVETELFPKLNTSISYGYAGSQNDVGILRSNSTLGATVNVGLSYTFFSGGRVAPVRKNAKIAIISSKISLDKIKYELTQEIIIAWNVYQNNIKLIPIEQKNVAISKQNLDRVTTVYRTGQINTTDYLQAQYNYIVSKNNLLKAELEAKKSAWQLYHLSGQLIAYNQ